MGTEGPFPRSKVAWAWTWLLYLHFSIHLHDMVLKTTRENFSVTEWLDNLLSLKCDSELIFHNRHSAIKYGHHVQQQIIYIVKSGDVTVKQEKLLTF
jgi:hypothetical protein